MDWKPMVTMLAVVTVFAVMNTLTKMAFNQGMHTTVLIVLRQLTATLFLAPIAYQWLFFFGLRYTTATFASAFINMTPMFTFLLALPFKLERIDVATGSGAAKLTGTAVGLAGAILMALYQGPALTGPRTTDHHPANAPHGGALGWAIGSAALLGGAASWSLWFILQSKIGTKYPALYSSTAWMFFLSTAQMAAVGAATEAMTLRVWLPGTALKAVTVLFVGVVGSGLAFLAMSWCVERRGPVFTTAFMPLIQIIAAGINVTVLREQLHLGSAVGSALVVAGLYLVLWGKSNEASTKSRLPPPPPQHSKLALDLEEEETEHGGGGDSRIIQSA